jgi:chromosome segregation ATPase
MDVEKLKEEIQRVVTDMLAQKDFAGIGKDIEDTLKSAEATLNDMITRLTESEKKAVEDATALEALKSEKDALTAEVSSLKTALETANSEKDSVAARLSDIENTLREIEENKRLDTRVVELSSLKVIRTGSALDNQKNVVKKMTDEEFASYRDELVALREDLIKNVEIASAATEENTESVVDEVTTPPADVHVETASVVVPVSTNSTVDRVKDIGDAFSKYMDERKKRAPK